jgi:hypothetical protein
MAMLERHQGEIATAAPVWKQKQPAAQNHNTDSNR